MKKGLILVIILGIVFTCKYTCFGIENFFNSHTSILTIQPSVRSPSNTPPTLQASGVEPGMIHIIWGEDTTADGIVSWTSDWVGRNLPKNVGSLSWDEVKNQIFKGKNVYRDLSGDKTLLLRIDTYDWVSETGKATRTSKNWQSSNFLSMWDKVDTKVVTDEYGEVKKATLGDCIDSKLAFHVDYYYVNDNVVSHLTTIEKSGWKTTDEGRLGQLVPDYTAGKFKVHVAGKEEHFDNYGEVIEYFSEKANSGIKVAEDTPVPTSTPLPTSTPSPVSITSGSQLDIAVNPQREKGWAYAKTKRQIAIKERSLQSDSIVRIGDLYSCSASPVRCGSGSKYIIGFQDVNGDALPTQEFTFISREKVLGWLNERFEIVSELKLAEEVDNEKVDEVIGVGIAAGLLRQVHGVNLGHIKGWGGKVPIDSSMLTYDKLPAWVLTLGRDELKIPMAIAVKRLDVDEFIFLIMTPQNPGTVANPVGHVFKESLGLTELAAGYFERLDIMASVYRRGSGMVSFVEFPIGIDKVVTHGLTDDVTTFYGVIGHGNADEVYSVVRAVEELSGVKPESLLVKVGKLPTRSEADFPMDLVYKTTLSEFSSAMAFAVIDYASFFNYGCAGAIIKYASSLNYDEWYNAGDFRDYYGAQMAKNMVFPGGLGYVPKFLPAYRTKEDRYATFYKPTKRADIDESEVIVDDFRLLRDKPINAYEKMYLPEGTPVILTNYKSSPPELPVIGGEGAHTELPDDENLVLIMIRRTNKIDEAISRMGVVGDILRGVVIEPLLPYQILSNLWLLGWVRESDIENVRSQQEWFSPNYINRW